jgi:hypothetical protein
MLMITCEKCHKPIVCSLKREICRNSKNTDAECYCPEHLASYMKSYSFTVNLVNELLACYPNLSIDELILLIL